MRKSSKKIKSPIAAKRYRRKLAIRSKIEGTAVRPRICVSKTNKHLFVQVVDDVLSKTLFSVQTYGKNAVKATSSKGKESAKLVGIKVAQELSTRNIKVAVFDRAGFKYAGVLAALVDSIREKGVKI